MTATQPNETVCKRTENEHPNKLAKLSHVINRYRHTINKLALGVLVIFFVCKEFDLFELLPLERSEIDKVTILAAVSVFAKILYDLCDELDLSHGRELVSHVGNLSKKFDNLCQSVDRRNRNRVYTDQTCMYEDLSKYVSNLTFTKAIFIQYSSQQAVNLLRRVMKEDVTIDLYIQNPVQAISRQQESRIRQAIGDLRLGLGRDIKGQLLVYDYAPPASIRGVLLDGEVLAIGPYTYENAGGQDQSCCNDEVEISGHDVPGMLLWADTPEYAVFRNMFLDLANNFREHSEDYIMKIASNRMELSERGKELLPIVAQRSGLVDATLSC